MNVTSLTPEMLGDVVNRAIPEEWRGKEEAGWENGGENQNAVRLTKI